MTAASLGCKFEKIGLNNVRQNLELASRVTLLLTESRSRGPVFRDRSPDYFGNCPLLRDDGVN